jgi:hypothetical protein
LLQRRRLRISEIITENKILKLGHVWLGFGRKVRPAGDQYRSIFDCSSRQDIDQAVWRTRSRTTYAYALTGTTSTSLMANKAYPNVLTPHHASSSSSFPLPLTTRPRRTTLMLSLLTLLLLLGYYHRIPYTWQSRLNEPGTKSYWAQYSPYAPVEMYAPPPGGCRVVQANIVRLVSFFFFTLPSSFSSLRESSNATAPVSRLRPHPRE